MIAYFGNKQHLCSPTKRRKGAGTFALAPEDEASIYATFDVLADELPRRHRAELYEHLIPTGNGIALVESMEQSFADSSTAVAYFKGQYLEADDTLTAAQKLLNAYTDDPWDDEEEAEQPKALRKLAALKTPYAFIIYDSQKGVIFAARDPRGIEQIFWGTNCSGDLLFCTDRALLEKLGCADADLFPAGALFVSEKDATTGRVVDIPPVPEEEDEESELDHVCRSISCSDFGGMGSRVPSQSQIAAK